MPARRLHKHFCKSVCAALALSCALASPAFAGDIRALIVACTEGGGPLAARAERIDTLGYARIEPESKMWVQGQLAHIGMSTLETGGDIRGTYEGFRQSADAGELFMTDIEQYSFADAAGTMHINLSAPEGNDPGCSIAFAKGITGIKIPLRTADTYESAAGTYTDYRISGDRYATLSTFASPWDTWIKGRRLVSAFMVVSR